MTEQLGLTFAQHIRFTTKHKAHTKIHYCCGQQATTKPGHEACPPEGIAAVILWIKITVKPDNHQEWGGKLKGQQSLIIRHFEIKLANSLSIMPLFKINVEDF